MFTNKYRKKYFFVNTLTINKNRPIFIYGRNNKKFYNSRYRKHPLHIKKRKLHLY